MKKKKQNKKRIPHGMVRDIAQALSKMKLDYSNTMIRKVIYGELQNDAIQKQALIWLASYEQKKAVAKAAQKVIDKVLYLNQK